MKYIEIIYLAEWDIPDDFFYWTEEEMVDYMKQWDYGTESEHCLSTYKNEPWGVSDKTYHKDDYVLAYNENMGYASLTRIITE